MATILPIALEHVAGFHAALASVARERDFLAMVEAPPLAWAQEFVSGNLAHGHAQVVALEAGEVVGWCDILPRRDRPGFQHCGSVGMGVVQAWRGRGLGRALLEACLERAFAAGLTRVELEVYADNPAAIALYRGLGFVEEGRKRRARFLDGRYQDLLAMALLREAD
jgi:RimJ/RimL family protein N-acetyltransferase